ncbi:unnamed protein product [Rotaria magnacalcarata]|uniref:Uncharacterized protein n=1 Tax=Rotaria magnacalcarata TaxID=392030 RepID=A0A816MZW0_9BILA|nr:unnamed protein product [Rotaria magnacalcarata]CAF1607273.1 unnamed protein product [Rotaria magnacalcarata]CAF2026008.1 unnamed protein product [Rotaria magnacalcarata]CAF2057515.1 unnamed protein product [Rotaria magnacalcarata]CAF2244785.1 unnamed protein product [Rotaria magnacalcarata]
MCYYIFLLIFINLSNGDQCKINNQTEYFISKSGQCVSCLSHCNYQTNVCLHANLLHRLCSSIYFARNIRECQQRLTPKIVRSFLLTNQSNIVHDDKDNDEPVCLFCGNSTRGLRCEYCRQRPNGKQLSHLIGLKTPSTICFECSCFGQTYDCRTNITNGCKCLSHLLDPNLVDLNLYQCLLNRTTVNNHEQSQCRSRIHQQCSNCKSGHNGVTSERGHRCYKALGTDTIQCFDYGNSVKSCLNGNEIIRSEDNGTISFEIIPNYRNLNIRVLIGIENGYVDVICSIRNANFIVKDNHHVYYEHQSLIDNEPAIRDYDLTNEDLNFGILYSDPTDIIILRNLSSRHRLTLLISPTDIDFAQDNLHCLLIDQPISHVRLPDLIDPQSKSMSFSLSDYRAIHLTVGSMLLSSKTNGFIKIYQSRMNIDLFVFFSVFFSSFFLFLSIGICFWKVKFAYEIHRRRRTLKHEYHKRMARPFAKVQLFMKPSTIVSNDEDNSPQLTFPQATSSSVDIPLLLPSTRTDIDYSAHVVSVEPLRDQSNCYTTLLFHLPGDLSTQYRLCAGTTLAQLPQDYANALSSARVDAELQKRNKRRKKYNGRSGRQRKVVVKKTTTDTRQQQQQRIRKQNQQQQQPRTTLGT